MQPVLQVEFGTARGVELRDVGAKHTEIDRGAESTHFDRPGQSGAPGELQQVAMGGVGTDAVPGTDVLVARGDVRSGDQEGAWCVRRIDTGDGRHVRGHQQFGTLGVRPNLGRHPCEEGQKQPRGPHRDHRPGPGARLRGPARCMGCYQIAK